MRMPAQIKPMVIHRRNACVAEGSPFKKGLQASPSHLVDPYRPLSRPSGIHHASGIHPGCVTMAETIE